MITILALALPAISLLTTPSHAAPRGPASSHGQTLAQRDNKYSIKCGNAPSVVAGTLVEGPMLSQNALTTPPEQTGSTESWMDYLWCTPGTKTYTFFGVGIMTPGPPPNVNFDVSGALNSAHANVTTYLQTNKDGPIAGGSWGVSPPGTNIDIFVQNSKGTMTHGILNAAMAGLAEVASSFVHKQTTMVFQINDGDWGEVGIGYVGFHMVGMQNGCAYDIVNSRAFPCSDVRDGWVIK